MGDRRKTRGSPRKTRGDALEMGEFSLWRAKISLEMRGTALFISFVRSAHSCLARKKTQAFSFLPEYKAPRRKVPSLGPKATLPAKHTARKRCTQIPPRANAARKSHRTPATLSADQTAREAGTPSL